MALVGHISGSSQSSSRIGVTGSVIFANRPAASFPANMPGVDTVFFVSGSIGGKAAGEVGSVAVFGGDAVISGSLTIGTGSIKITSNDIQFGSPASKIELNGSDLKFYDASNPSGFTLTSLGSGGGGGGSTYWFSNTANVIYTTGSAVVSGSVLLKRADGTATLTLDNVMGDITGSAATFTSAVAVGGALTVGGGYGATGVTIGADGVVQANGGLTVDGTSLFKSNVTVAGDFTVNGTVVALETVNTKIKDAVLLLGSGSESGGPAPFKSIIAFASGSKNANESVTFGVAGDRVLGVGVQDVLDGGLAQTGISFSSLGSLIAKDYQVVTATAALKAGGTAGSVELSGSAVSFQSAASNDVSYTADGVTYATIGKSSGDATFKGVGTTWFTGSSVYIQSNTGAVNIAAGTNTSLVLSTDGATFGTVAAKLGSGTPKILNLSGSTVNIGANTGTSGVTFQMAGASVVNLAAATSTTPILSASQVNSTFTIGTFGTSDAVVLSGSTIQFNAGSSGQSFRRDGTEFLLVSSGAAGPNQRALLTAASGKTFLIGGTSETIISGSSVTLTSGRSGSPSGVDFSTDVAGMTVSYLNIVSGSYSTPAGSVTINAAKIVPGDLPVPHDVLLGASAARSLYLSGTAVYVNGSASSLVVQRHGASLASLSGPDANTFSIAAEGSVTTANLFSNNVTALNVGSNVTSNATYNLATGGTTTGNTKTVNLGTGAAAGSTTTISIGSIIGGATTVNGNMVIGGDGSRTLEIKSKITGSLIPNADVTYDLGSPLFRWANMYTGDLHLKNDRGDWTIIEEADFLTITNNKNGKRYKFVLQEIG